MKAIITTGAVFLLAAALPAAPAQPSAPRYGTEDQAQALVEKAVAMLRKEGPDKTLAAINLPSGSFLNRDLYVFVIGPDKKIAADAANPSRVGQDIAPFRDSDGKPWALLVYYQANPDGAWISYEDMNPQTHRVEDKSTWAVREGDYIVAAGAYSPPAKPAAAPASPGKWAGVWKLSSQDGTPYTVTLTDDGRAESDRREEEKGFWIAEGDHVRIDWNDGWTDVLVGADKGFHRLAFAPDAPREGDPTFTSDAVREEPDAQ
jgi:cytochrome c